MAKSLVGLEMETDYRIIPRLMSLSFAVFKVEF